MEKLNNKKINKEKGITLIALVITIIVLLILAGVSIATLTGPNGLLSQANEAKIATEKAEAKERVELEVVGSYDNSGTFQMEKLKENLKNNLGIAEEGIEENEDGSITFTLDGNKVTVDENGQVEVGEKVPVIKATSIEVEDLILNGKETKKLKVTTTPREITEELEYTLKSTDIATVDKTGMVTGISKGTATIEVSGKISKVKKECTITVEEGIGIKVTGENKKYTNNGTAVIPVGFCIVPGCEDISEGLVISDDPSGIEGAGNEFVWIPVTDTSSYARNLNYPKSFTEEIQDDVEYLPNLEGVDILNEITSESEKEKYLVTSKGGFYISRYEAGDSQATEKRTSVTDGTLVSKKGAYVYTYISQENAKEKAKGFINDANVKSGLCTGIQWDMVMAFVNEKNDGEGRKYYVETASSYRHKGKDVGIEQSGQNPADKVCNIYDLEGNSYEYVAEKNNSTKNPYVLRGGIYNFDYSASNRNLYGGIDDKGISFRFVLYVM